MDADEFALQGPRTDGDIRAVALKNREQFIRFLDRGGKVGVGEKHVLARRFQHSMADCEPFAMVAVVPNQPNARKLLDGLDRLVRRTVVHHDQLHGVRLRRLDVTKLLQGVTNSPRFVVRRNYNA